MDDVGSDLDVLLLSGLLDCLLGCLVRELQFSCFVMSDDVVVLSLDCILFLKGYLDWDLVSLLYNGFHCFQTLSSGVNKGSFLLFQIGIYHSVCGKFNK